MIRNCTKEDFKEIWNIINDAAKAYQGVIPSDCWHEPYMTEAELQTQIADGVEFFCYVDNNEVVGVMGIQDRGEVKLIRHAYVRSNERNRGIGSRLLQELVRKVDKPVLIGTWKAAVWAIGFYEKHGFSLVDDLEKNRLLRKYWTIPDRQIETSVVLVDSKYRDARDFSGEKSR